MKRKSIPKSGRVGDTVYYVGRYGLVAREHVDPKNPRTQPQQDHRDNVRIVSARWHTLTPQQRAAWCLVTASTCFVAETGQRVRLNGYNFFVSLNTRRADLGLPQFDLPPARPGKGSDRRLVLARCWPLTLRGDCDLACMPRTMRVEYPGAIYHVKDRGDRREDIFQSDDDRRLFLETLGQAFEQPVERSWDLGGQELVCENTPF